jgi:hypothetical protein
MLSSTINKKSEVSGVRCQDLVRRFPDLPPAENLTPETYITWAASAPQEALFPSAGVERTEADMDTAVTLANWRTAPHSSQSFQNVDQLVPVSRIKGPERTWELAVDLQPLDSLVFEDHHGHTRRLPEVLDTTATHGLVVLRGGAAGG